jgi:hypothetical protein
LLPERARKKVLQRHKTSTFDPRSLATMESDWPEKFGHHPKRDQDGWLACDIVLAIAGTVPSLAFAATDGLRRAGISIR